MTELQSHEQLIASILINAGFKATIKHAGVLAFLDRRRVSAQEVATLLSDLIDDGLVTVSRFDYHSAIVKIAA